MRNTAELSAEHNTSQFHFGETIDAITARRLTPKNINSYATDALDDLIEVVSDITMKYNRQPTVTRGTSKENEEAALAYFGLDPAYVDVLLDYIAKKSQEIAGLDLDIERVVQKTDRVVVPTESKSSTDIVASDGSFEKRTELRLQAIIFLLKNKFELDIENKKQFILTEGVNDTNMVRQAGYYAVELPTLNRILAVSNAVDEATFIGDAEAMMSVGVDSSAWLSLTKEQRIELFEQNPGMGMKLTARDSYIEDVARLLTEIPKSIKEFSSKKSEEVELLRPSDVIFATQVASKLNMTYGSSISHKTIYRIADALMNEGVISPKNYPFRTYAIKGYTESDYVAIEERLKEMGMLYPAAPKSVQSVKTMVANEFTIGSQDYKDVLDDIINRAKELFGNLETYRFVSASSLGVTEEQYPIVKEWVDAHVERVQARRAARKVLNDTVAKEKATPKRPELHPEGYMTLTEIGEVNEVSAHIYDKAFDTVKALLGEIKEYTHGPRGFRSFSPEQRKIIEAEIARLKIAERTPGRLTVNEIAPMVGVSPSVLREVIKEGNYPFLEERVSNRPSPTYDGGIVEALALNPRIRRLANMPLESNGVVALSTYARSRHMSNTTAEKVIRKYHMPIGEFGFGARKKPAVGLLPADQRFIDNELGKEVPDESPNAL